MSYIFIVVCNDLAIIYFLFRDGVQSYEGNSCCLSTPLRLPGLKEDQLSGDRPAHPVETTTLLLQQ